MRFALREIDREKGWREKPVGPIGLHITLLDSKWIHIIERYFGGALGGFIVTNYADGNLLKKILERTRCNAPQYVMAPKQFTINEPDEAYPTILRTIQVDHPLVRQQLIIQHSAEQTLLIQDLNEANRIMAKRGPGDNIAMCFAIHQSRSGYGHKVGGAGYGSMSVTPMMPWNGASRMKSTGRDEQEEVREQISRHQAEHQRLVSNVTAQKRRVDACEAALYDHQRQKRQLRVRIQEKEEECERLQARIEQMAVDGQLGALQESLKVRTPLISNTDRSAILNLVLTMDEPSGRPGR
jgi:chromosome segregation ATPase